MKDAGKADQYISLGDVVNYGPWSNECVQYLESLDNCIKIMGNHEQYFINGECSVQNFLAKEFFNTCFTGFTEADTIKEYLLDYSEQDFVFCHTLNDEYIYQDTNIQLDENYVIGHSHHQYQVESNKYILVNPGSVGQNRKYINEINYLIFDSANTSFDFRNIIYDVGSVINEMVVKGFPEVCVDYYRNKSRK